MRVRSTFQLLFAPIQAFLSFLLTTPNNLMYRWSLLISEDMFLSVSSSMAVLIASSLMRWLFGCLSTRQSPFMFGFNFTRFHFGAISHNPHTNGRLITTRFCLVSSRILNDAASFATLVAFSPWHDGIIVGLGRTRAVLAAQDIIPPLTMKTQGWNWNSEGGTMELVKWVRLPGKDQHIEHAG